MSRKVLSTCARYGVAVEINAHPCGVWTWTSAGIRPPRFRLHNEHKSRRALDSRTRPYALGRRGRAKRRRAESDAMTLSDSREIKECSRTARRRHHSNATGLFSGPPSGPQWPRRGLSTERPIKFRHLRIKGNCQLFDNSDRRILPAPLKSADVRPINTDVDGQRFLRRPAANAQPSDISGCHGLCIHGHKRSFMGLLNHG
jgi:hypothetical protein